MYGKRKTWRRRQSNHLMKVWSPLWFHPRYGVEGNDRLNGLPHSEQKGFEKEPKAWTLFTRGGCSDLDVLCTFGYHVCLTCILIVVLNSWKISDFGQTMSSWRACKAIQGQLIHCSIYMYWKGATGVTTLQGLPSRTLYLAVSSFTHRQGLWASITMAVGNHARGFAG